MKSSLRRGLCGLLLACLILMSIPGLADNLAYYEALYGEDASAYKTIRYGAKENAVQTIKEQLAALGYFPNKVNTSYYKTLEVAVRVFAQQMGIPGDGREITPLMRAMLADGGNLPQAIAPGIDIYAYSLEKDGSTFTLYNYARLMRNNTINQVRVSFRGQITQVITQSQTQYLTLQLDSDAEKIVYVSYEPLPRTTRFQVGDAVTIFGETQGLQALAQEGMGAERLLVHAQRIGYTN